MAQPDCMRPIALPRCAAGQVSATRTEPADHSAPRPRPTRARQSASSATVRDVAVAPGEQRVGEDREDEDARPAEPVGEDTRADAADGRGDERHRGEEPRLRAVEAELGPDRRERERVEHDVHRVEHPARRRGDEGAPGLGRRLAEPGEPHGRKTPGRREPGLALEEQAGAPPRTRPARSGPRRRDGAGRGRRGRPRSRSRSSDIRPSKGARREGRSAAPLAGTWTAPATTPSVTSDRVGAIERLTLESNAGPAGGGRDTEGAGEERRECFRGEPVLLGSRRDAQEAPGPGPAGSGGVDAAAARREAEHRPTERMSPAFRARPSNPPKPVATSVDRLPRSWGTSIPPRTQRYARAPEAARPRASRAPAGTRIALHGATSSPSSVAANGAPATTTSASSSKRSVGPASVASRAAAPSSFPRRRFPRRRACASAAPPGGTPSAPRPGRPRSWTVVRSPVERTRIIASPLRGDRSRAATRGRTGPRRRAGGATRSRGPGRREEPESAPRASSRPASRAGRAPSGLPRSRRFRPAPAGAARGGAVPRGGTEGRGDRRSRARSRGMRRGRTPQRGARRPLRS